MTGEQAGRAAPSADASSEMAARGSAAAGESAGTGELEDAGAGESAGASQRAGSGESAGMTQNAGTGKGATAGESAGARDGASLTPATDPATATALSPDGTGTPTPGVPSAAERTAIRDAIFAGEGAIARAARALADSDLARRDGRVNDLIGLIVEATGLAVEVGEVCYIDNGRNRESVACEVVGFRRGRTLLMPLGDLQGIAPGTTVRTTGMPLRVAVGSELLGRVLDGLGNPIDDGPAPDAEFARSTIASPPDPLTRPRIRERVGLGVRALDALVPCGRGQRLGIFAGSGVGKSSLLGMIARSSGADVNVIALVGERGREVREFIESDLGDALSRSVVVVATSDQPALVRIRAAFTATAIAEHFRDAGNDVLLMMDSVTRFAMAQREVGLAVGEPPATRGYTPSVFALLPRLLERAGTSEAGSITGLYTVLVDGDDMNEPIADAVRSILDGHIVLTRELAHAGHYPAIDVLASVSRLIGDIVTAPVREGAQQLRAALAALREKEDLIAIGAYQRGGDPLVDSALAHRSEIEAFLRQAVEECSTLAQADEGLVELAARIAQDAGAAHAEPAEVVLEAEIVEAVAAEQSGSAIPPLSLVG